MTVVTAGKEMTFLELFTFW